MGKESYTIETEFMGEKFIESYDIKVTDEGVEYIQITDSNGRMIDVSWKLIKTLHKNIKRQLDYFEEMEKLSEEGEQ